MSSFIGGPSLRRPSYSHLASLEVDGLAAVALDLNDLPEKPQFAYEVLLQECSGKKVMLRLDGTDATPAGDGILIRPNEDKSFPCDPSKISLILADGEVGSSVIRVHLAVA